MGRKRRKFTAKNKLFTIRRIGVLLLGLALIVGAIIGIVSLLKKKDKIGTTTELSFGAGTEYVFTGSGFYYIDGESLVWNDIADPAKNNRVSLGAQDAKMVTGGGTTAIYSGSNIQILGTSNVIDVGSNIVKLSCGSSLMAVLCETEAGTASVAVFNSAGEHIDTIESDSASVIDCGMYDSENGSILWTLALDLTGSIPVNTLTTYIYTIDGAGVPRASMSGVMSVQGQLIDRVILSAGSIFMAGTEQLIRYDGTANNESGRALTYGFELEDYSLRGSVPTFVYRSNDAADSERINVYTMTEESVPEVNSKLIKLPEDTVSAMAMKGYIYAVSAGKISQYSSAGKLVATYDTETACTGAVKLDEGHFILECAGNYRLVTLK